jgi:hypothetical protein
MTTIYAMCAVGTKAENPKKLCNIYVMAPSALLGLNQILSFILCPMMLININTQGCAVLYWAVDNKGVVKIGYLGILSVS